MALDSKVSHADIVAFADDHVNLKREDVRAHRDQVNQLRARLDNHIAAHPAFDLVKMLQSGSVAKGTALKTINDMDVAVYVRAGKAPEAETELLVWVSDRLREAYGGLMKADQFVPQHHCVQVQFRGSGLDVDVAPVIYEGGTDDIGYLIAKDTGERVLTSIPLHLTFTRRRKAAHPRHYRQMVRLVKWWKRIQAAQHESFRFKSFMTE
ncbi:MAG TPA: CBASS oligonucleotide cyclase, partial [Stellaceae bacterium]|nr:CBASS oligonucleotide cyclase [Stellaceae bacterium]